MLSSQLHLHKLPHFLCRFLLHFPRHMGVGIQREAGGVVAQHPGERLNVDTVLEGHGGKSMPQIMKTAVLQSGIPKDSLVDSCHGLRAVHGSSCWGREQIWIIWMQTVFLYQQIHSLLRDQKRPDGMLGLGLTHHQFSIQSAVRFRHRDASVLWGQIAPEQGQQLAAAQAGG